MQSILVFNMNGLFINYVFCMACKPHYHDSCKKRGYECIGLCFIVYMVSRAMGIEIHNYYEVNKLGDIIKTNPISLFNKTNLAIFVILIANLAPICLQRDVQTH